MPRRRQHIPLRVLLNNRLVGRLLKTPSGGLEFRYDASWLEQDEAIPVSLSLSLSEESYQGNAVTAVFENLLPDSIDLRRRVAQRVGATGTDAYSLLSAIGRDCVGALQFLREEDESEAITGSPIKGEPVNDAAIESLLRGLAYAPLGLRSDDPFRISVAGAQEKTALLLHKKRWIKPHGTTPTTHIFKKQIGKLPNGIDLSNSVENEYYCLRLASAFGLPVNRAEMRDFGTTRALVIERFDRLWTKDGRLLRLPQEDCCQALSVPPTRKYQNQGGPTLVHLFDLLRNSDFPEDRETLFKAQIFFWLIGATDGHAKNFSIFLGPGGSFKLTPLYDILTAQPSLDARQIERKQMKLAMSVGTRNHYRFNEVLPRHFMQTGEAAGLTKKFTQRLIEQIAAIGESALEKVERELPANFPMAIHESVSKALKSRLNTLRKV